MRPRALLGTVALALVACGPRARPRTATGPGGHELTLYRDHAAVKQLVDIDVPRAGTTAIRVQVAAGVRVDDVVVLDHGPLAITGLHGPLERRGPQRGVTFDVAASTFGERTKPGPRSTGPSEPPPPASSGPTELMIDVTAPRAGHYRLHLGYTTDRLTWSAAYTMTAAPARDRVTLRGALEIRNTSGVTFARAQVYLVDAELRSWRRQAAARLAAELAGTPPAPSGPAPAHALGVIELRGGDSRFELLRDEPARAMRSVLVYDPIGTALDHRGVAPLRDPQLGVTPPAPSRVTESFEIVRPPRAPAGLPAGPVRLLEQRPDGAIAVLGQARLFDAETRVAEVDTIAIGTARGVTGRRARRDLTIDDRRKRLVEEVVLTIENTRPHPVEVVLREHLYRGQNWTLAYQSGTSPTKDGPQQISLRTTVPAAGVAEVLYVVVYTWP